MTTADTPGTVSFAPDHENARAFRDALGRFTTGVCVITLMGDTGPVGFTANSFASLSMDPPLVLWSPAKSSSRYPQLVAAECYSIHVLAHDQGHLGARFVRGGDGFTGLDPALTEQGVPVLDDVLARFDCARHALHDGGDHTIVVGRVMQVTTRPGNPLVFNAGRYGGFHAG